MQAFLSKRMPALYRVLLDLRDRAAPFYADPELSLLPVLCPAGTVALDIGANTGLYTHWLLRRARLVVAVEPIPRLSQLVVRRFAAAVRDGRLIVENCALGNEDGSATLHIPDGMTALSTLQPLEGMANVADITVPVHRLDGLDSVRDLPIGFMKIDVEGFESAVIEGGLGLLRRHQPTILVEAEERHRPGAVAALRGLLEPLGYSGFFRMDGQWHPVESFDAARLQNRAALNEAGTKRLKGATYINNFVFTASPESLRAA
ncbi:FkbM family methyltransferase [Oceanibaculum indicum]|uniref:FkbM family methyltransferase n=1 Tax=Oceanibaculum indicum P24 TaxID=1207063 RepID=K2JPZ4_9PROT|nr:FkbM family methyltransferase [Oceanibaculum indicum]EKE77328.1 FkbM family methyltransferase [Oceanibaculum indicum P24]